MNGDASAGPPAPEPGADGQQGGYMHMLPVFVPAAMTVTHVSFAMLPWFSFSYGGIVGTTTGSPPEPAVAVTFEWPMTWLRTIQDLPKIEREMLYIRRFSADQALATSVHAFSAVRPGPHPNRAPDTLVTTDQGDFGVESTCLTVPGRRGAYSLFQNLRQRILLQEPTAFAGLAGYMVYAWFEEPGGQAGLALPLRRNDDNAAIELLRELAAYKPQPGQMWHPSGPPPQQAPALRLATTPAGARFYAVPLTGAAPATMLYTMTGFELGLAYTTVLTAQAAWQEVQRLVDQHDQPGVDKLLITAGAPDHRGQIFPAEEAIASFLLETPLGLTRPPSHIKQVLLHSWATGLAAELHPAVTTLFGPIYQSFQPEHSPLIQPAAS